MSFLCSSSTSTSGFLLPKVAPRQVLSFLYPFDFSREPQRRRYHRKTSQEREEAPREKEVERWFIGALASAGSCRNHNQRKLQNGAFFTDQRSDVLGKGRRKLNSSSERWQHTRSSDANSGGNTEATWRTIGSNIDSEVNTESFSRKKVTYTKLNAEKEWEPGPEIDAISNVKMEQDLSLETNPDEEYPGQLPLEPNRTKEELMALVDQYDHYSYTDQLPPIELPNLYQPVDGPVLTISDRPQDEWPPPESKHSTWRGGEVTDAKVRDLMIALEDVKREPEEIYELYKELPEPRVPYLDSKTRHRLLRHLSVVERKDEISMLRYMSVIEDLKQCAIPLSVTEWNSAISFAARYANNSTEMEVESALHMWREMEHVAGVKASSATFNCLFDVAVKAGKYALAEMITLEQQNRGLELDRFHHVGMIFYYGQIRSGDGARQAYKKLVEAGEIVDTVVLNAMISALIKSCEPTAAENIYERMKTAHLDRKGVYLPPKHWKDAREIKRALKNMGRAAKHDLELRKKHQEKASITPDLHTFRILVAYFAIESGELDKTAKLLNEMQWFELGLHGAIFTTVFKGFEKHGGIRYTQWTDSRLEQVWKSLILAMDTNAEGVYVSRFMVSWALRAFAKCSGKQRMLDAWEEIKVKWDSHEDDVAFVLDTMNWMLEKPDANELRDDWLLGAGRTR